jgi:putative tricarboxylic transport membrane protein
VKVEKDRLKWLFLFMMKGGFSMAKFRELFSGVAFFAFSIFLYALSYQIKMTKADPIGPQFFPRLVALLIALLSILSIVRGISQIRERNMKSKRVANSDDKTKASYKPNYSFLFSILLLIAYMLFIQKIGFILLSIVYLFFQIYLISPKEELKRRNLIIYGIISVCVPIALYFVFYNAFNIFLPPGILG